MIFRNNFWLIPLLLVGLFLTRRQLTFELAKLITKFGGGNHAFTVIWSAIFLPGTIIHEVSHLLAATATGAKTGKIEIFPTRLSNDHIRLGSVQTQELGIIRGFIVGTAPLLIGLILLIWLSSMLRFTFDDFRPLDFARLYLFFTVANSLFISWQDLKLALPLIVIGAILTAGFYYWGIRPNFTADAKILTAIDHLNQALLIGAVVNIAISLALFIANKLLTNNRARDHAANTR